MTASTRPLRPPATQTPHQADSVSLAADHTQPARDAFSARPRRRTTVPIRRGPARARHWVVDRTQRLRAQPDRGSVLPWIAMTIAILGSLLVLVVDGSTKTTAREQAQHYAAEAARAAVIAVGPASGGAQTDCAVAARAANDYLTRAGVQGNVTVIGPATVTVTVTVHRTGPISGVSITAVEHATARLLVGVETGQAP